MKTYKATYEVTIENEITRIENEIRDAQDERDLRSIVRYAWSNSQINFISIAEVK